MNFDPIGVFGLALEEEAFAGGDGRRAAALVVRAVPAVDFGIPVVGYRTAEGTYLENSQLEPDVKVPLDLNKAINGEDTQLEAAVKELLKVL